MSDDLPTFERPAMAISGGPGGGAPPVGPAAPRKRAAVMRTTEPAADQPAFAARAALSCAMPLFAARIWLM